MPPRQITLVLIFLPPVATLALWGIHLNHLSGNSMGSMMATLQSILSLSGDDWLLRDFNAVAPSVDLSTFFRKMLNNLNGQVGDFYIHLGHMIPAVLFFVSILHPFKRYSTGAFRWTLAIIWGFATLGMAATGLPQKASDDNQLHSLFIPLMTGYGLAFLAVLWGRLGLGRRGWWVEHGFAALAIGMSALPMVISLPPAMMIGLSFKDQLANWPPYVPDRMAKLSALTSEKEVLFTDAPWAIAWYADRHCVWLPMEKKQFLEMRKLIQDHGDVVAGFVMTPISSTCDSLSSIFTGEYGVWAPQIFWGYTAGFNVDVLGQEDFPYRQVLPLVGRRVGDRNILEMIFLTDTKRW